MANPASPVNGSAPAQSLDYRIGDDGIARLKRGVGSHAPTGAATASMNDGVATHLRGSAVGSTDELVLAGFLDATGNAQAGTLDAAGNLLISSGTDPVGTNAGTQAGSTTVGVGIRGWLSTLAGIFQTVGGKVQGLAASGAAVAGNPVLVAGSDGTNARNMLTDATGRVLLGLPLGTDVTGSATGAATALAPALPAVAAKTNYITGIEVTGAGATLGSAIAVTITGTITGTLTYILAVPAGVLVGAAPLVVEFSRPIPASAVNTAITLNVPSFGAGNTNAAAALHGFVL